MNGFLTMGSWVPVAGEEEAFATAWAGFARWAGTFPGAGELTLSRDLGDPTRFVSFGRWDDLASVHGWKSSAEFPTRMAALQRHVAQFAPSELEVVRSVTSASA